MALDKAVAEPRHRRHTMRRGSDANYLHSLAPTKMGRRHSLEGDHPHAPQKFGLFASGRFQPAPLTKAATVKMQHDLIEQVAMGRVSDPARRGAQRPPHLALTPPLLPPLQTARVDQLEETLEEARMAMLKLHNESLAHLPEHKRQEAEALVARIGELTEESVRRKPGGRV